MSTIPRNFIVLLGALVAIAVLALGVVGFALPILSQASDLNAQADQIDSQNASQEAAIASLKKQRDDLTALTSEVEDLQKAVPADRAIAALTAHVVNAAAVSQATLVSLTPAASTPWSATGTAPTAGTEAATGQSAPAASATPAPTASADASTTPTAAPAATGAVQTSVVVVATVPSADAAAAFVDALRGGDRAAQITNVALAGQGAGTGGMQVTVTFLVFSLGATS